MWWCQIGTAHRSQVPLTADKLIGFLRVSEDGRFHRADIITLAENLINVKPKPKTCR